MREYLVDRSASVVVVLAMLGLHLTISQVALAQENTLEEIVVTAEKREQSLQDVALGVSAVSGDRIEESGLSTVIDIAKILPGINFTDANRVSTDGFRM